MKLATFKTAQGTSYGIVTGKGIVDLKRYIGNRFADLKALIGGNAFAEAAKHLSEAPDYGEADITWLPVIPKAVLTSERKAVVAWAKRNVPLPFQGPST